MLSPTLPIDRPNLHSGTEYLIGPRVPHGLAAVVEGLTREVLRHRPEDIYVFAAHHFEKLLKLREQYHAEEYSGHKFNRETSREFNLWPTKESKDIKESLTNSWSLNKEIKILKRHKRASFDVEESPEDISTDREKQKTSKHTRPKDSNTKKSLRKSKSDETTLDPRATRIISQALHSHSKNILTKDIKQELRKNKLSSEKGKKIDDAGKQIRGERRSRTKVPKFDKAVEVEIEHIATTSGRTSTRRPLRKVRRIETESETETEHEIMTKANLENGYEKSNIKDECANREATITRTGSREKKHKTTTQLSEHSFERKVSSRALSMDRIRAYVLRKFASTASLEVLRSPTYVEQVQEVIDRAAPIIKEKLQEMRRPRGKRSKSVDLPWNEESLRQHIQDRRRHGEIRDEKKEEGSRRKIDITEREETVKSPKLEDQSTEDEISVNMKKEEWKPKRRSINSGEKSKRREGSDRDNFEIIDQVDDFSKHNNNNEYNSSATRDTLEARLTATQNILEGISMSTSELGGVRKIDTSDSEHAPSESEVSNHGNVVSLPIVRPPSSKNCKSTTRNNSKCLTLPPISPEAPKSTKKKDELSLPILSATVKGNHSTKLQEQDYSKDAEEASTMRDITSDMEDIAVLPEDEHEDTITDAKQDPTNASQNLTSDLMLIDNEKVDKDPDEELCKDVQQEPVEECENNQDVEEYEELVESEEKRMEDDFKDSLNVTPEVVDILPRPDSLEPNENEQKKLRDDDVDPIAQSNMFDGLKDKLIEIEMAERNIEKALTGQQDVTHNDEVTSEAEKSVIDGNINEIRKSINEAKEIISDVEELTEEEKIPQEDIEEKGLSNETEKSINEVKNTLKSSTNKMENSIEELTSDAKESTSEMGQLTSKLESKTDIELSTNGKEIAKIKQAEVLLKLAKEALQEEEKSMNETERSKKEKSLNGVEESVVKRHITDTQSTNLHSQKKVDEIIETAACEMLGNENMTVSKSKTEPANELSKSTSSENTAIESECLKISDEDNIGETSVDLTRKKREINELPATTQVSLKIPFSYVLSEGSPCEIPDSVTTVIIPDRSSPSPEIFKDENCQLDNSLELTNLPIEKEEELTARYDIVEDTSSKDETRVNKNQDGYGMEAFGEYICPETSILPVDIDFMRSVKDAKPSQDIVITHQDLDRIKEEGEEEEEEKEKEKEKEEKSNEQTEKHSQQEKKDDEIIVHKETMKPATLENIVEHEENEIANVKIISDPENVEEILSSRVPEYELLSDTAESAIDVNLMAEEKMNIVESKNMLENSSEESGSSQDNHTSSGDAKVNTVSNQSIENSNIDRLMVPELNLDSLQDNTVSSFKMTANGTVTKESNDSLKESDATMSLIEPLTPDEKLAIENQLLLTDQAEEEIFAEEFTEKNMQSEVPEADQLYQAEHIECEWLEKDPLSLEVKLDNKTKSQEITNLETTSEEELGSEEEIARELIGSLDEEIQSHVKELDPKETPKNGRSLESSLDVEDKSSQSLVEIVQSVLVNESEKEEQEVNSAEFQTLDSKEITKTEAVDESSSYTTDINQENKDIDKKTDESKLEVEKEKHVGIMQIAPLAQFEQDEYLEQNNGRELIDEDITAENKSEVINTDSIDNQEEFEEQTNIKEIREGQNNESISIAEEFSEKQEESEQENYKQEKLEIQEIQQKELDDQEEYKQEKTRMHEECKEKNLESQEETKQEKFNTEEKDEQENLQVKIDIDTVTESKEGLIMERIESNDDDETDLTKLITHDEDIIDDRVQQNAKNEEEKKIKDSPAEIESACESVTSAPSEQSIEDYHYGRSLWTTKSSTVETVIAADSNNSIDEKMEALDNTPEITEDELTTRKEDDLYSAVVKIQAYIRGFLTRRHAWKIKESMSNKNLLTQKTAADDHLMMPNVHLSVRESRTGRQRLRREEALRKTTLSLENAFATSRLQHTGEFHDSVPLPLFDMTNDETNSNSPNESFDKETKDEQVKSYDNSTCDDDHGESFQKGTILSDHSTFPIVMHLLTGAPRNHHFEISQNSDSNFNSNTGEMKFIEPTVDILMMGYPKNNATLQNSYLNFITSVEDVGSNVDFLPLDDTLKSSGNIDEAHPSTISGDGSLREPLALPGIPQGVVIEELTSLDEAGTSESAKLSIAKTSLNTNSSILPEEHAFENEKNDLRTSPISSPNNTIEDQKNMSEIVERQPKQMSVENTFEIARENNIEDANVPSQVFHDNNEHIDEEKNGKI